MGKRYYWLKLKTDFFKRHDIKILLALYGADVVLFYIRLLVESVDHEGKLRFSEDVPYTAEMLAVITDTEKSFADDALQKLLDLKLIEKDDEGTLIFPKIDSMIGSAADNDHAKRQERYRKRLKEAESDESVTDSVTKSDAGVTQSDKKSDERIEIEIDKEIEIEKDKEKKEKAPAKKKYGSYLNVLLTDDEYDKLFAKYGAVEANEAIEYLSLYICEKAYKSKSHYLSIQRWVIDAVRERRTKKKAPASSLNDTYARIAQFVEDAE